MKVLIDIGNSNTKFAICDNSFRVLFSFSISTLVARSPDEYCVLLHYFFMLHHCDLPSVKSVFIISVVPSVNINLQNSFLSLGIKSVKILLESDFLNYGITIGMSTKNVGVDRLSELIGARKVVCEGKLLVIVVGTVTTFNLLSSDNIFYGQIIATGLMGMERSLRNSTALLPQVSLEKRPNLVGSSVIEAIKSGVYWGYVSMIQGIISSLTKEEGDFNIIISVGKHSPVAEYLLQFGEQVENLSLKGVLELVKVFSL